MIILYMDKETSRILAYTNDGKNNIVFSDTILLSDDIGSIMDVAAYTSVDDPEDIEYYFGRNKSHKFIQQTVSYAIEYSFRNGEDIDSEIRNVMFNDLDLLRRSKLEIVALNTANHSVIKSEELDIRNAIEYAFRAHAYDLYYRYTNNNRWAIKDYIEDSIDHSCSYVNICVSKGDTINKSFGNIKRVDKKNIFATSTPKPYDVYHCKFDSKDEEVMFYLSCKGSIKDKRKIDSHEVEHHFDRILKGKK